MKAVNLQQVVQYFDPKESLQGQHLHMWFVERPDTPRRRMDIALTTPQKPVKLLLVGHRGTGKSTELNKLAEEIKDKFYTIGFDALAVTGRSTMKYEDLMLTLSTHITRHCIDQGLVGRPLRDPIEGKWQELSDWWRQRVAGFGLGAPQDSETMASLSTLLGDIEIGVSQSAFTRDELNKFVDREMPELIRRLNWVIKEAERHLNPKRLLLVVEGLDKIDLEAARHIFRDHAPTITALDASMIYTFPLALRYSDDYQIVRKFFDRDVFLPNVPIRHEDGTEDEPGRRALQQMVLRRMNESLIATDALEQLVLNSGGIAIELIKLVNNTTLFALERDENADQIILQDARRAVKELRGELSANLTRKEWHLLKARHSDRLLTNEQDIEKLLHKGALIEYPNDKSWCDVNPVLWGLLDHYTEEDDGNPAAG